MSLLSGCGGGGGGGGGGGVFVESVAQVEVYDVIIIFPIYSSCYVLHIFQKLSYTGFAFDKTMLFFAEEINCL